MNILLIILLALPTGVPSTKAKPTKPVETLTVVQSTRGVCDSYEMCPKGVSAPIICKMRPVNPKALLCEVEIDNKLTQVLFMQKNDSKVYMSSPVLVDELFVHFMLARGVDHKQANKLAENSLLQKLHKLVGWQPRFHLMFMVVDEPGQKPMIISTIVWGAK